MSVKLLKVGRAALVAAAICVATVPSPSWAETPDAWLAYVEAKEDLYVDTGVVAKRGTKVEYRGTYGSPTPSAPNRDILVGASAGGTGGNVSEWGLIRNCSSKISLAYNNNSATMKTSVVFPPDVDAMLTITSEVTTNGASSSIQIGKASCRERV